MLDRLLLIEAPFTRPCLPAGIPSAACLQTAVLPSCPLPLPAYLPACLLTCLPAYCTCSQVMQRVVMTLNVQAEVKGVSGSRGGWVGGKGRRAGGQAGGSGRGRGEGGQQGVSSSRRCWVG